MSYEKLVYENKFPVISHGSDGLIGRQEAQYLNLVASRLSFGVFVELGTYKGRAAACIADGIRTSKSESVLWTFDTYDRRALSGRFSKDPEQLRRSLVTDMLDERNLLEYVCVFDMESYVAPKKLNLTRETPIKFLFLDADHSYKATKKDWLAWSPYLHNEAEVAFHDSNLDDVRRVIDELDGWEQVDEVMTISVVKRC